MIGANCRNEEECDGSVVKCAVCGYSQVVALRDYRSPFIDNVYTLYSCAECESRCFQIDEQPTELVEIYDDYAHGISGTFNKPFAVSDYWSDQVRTASALLGRRVDSVLDVGCRTGDFLMHWPEDVARVGVELTAHWAEVANKRGLDIKQDYLEKVEFGRRFDLVTCYAVIEHLRSPVAFLRKLPDLVEEDGIVVI
ncbi:unnamed protein product, partial [marine sediment metagenome]